MMNRTPSSARYHQTVISTLSFNRINHLEALVFVADIFVNIKAQFILLTYYMILQVVMHCRFAQPWRLHVTTAGKGNINIIPPKTRRVHYLTDSESHLLVHRWSTGALNLGVLAPWKGLICKIIFNLLNTVIRKSIKAQF